MAGKKTPTKRSRNVSKVEDGKSSRATRRSAASRKKSKADMDLSQHSSRCPSHNTVQDKSIDDEQHDEMSSPSLSSGSLFASPPSHAQTHQIHSPSPKRRKTSEFKAEYKKATRSLQKLEDEIDIAPHAHSNERGTGNESADNEDKIIKDCKDPTISEGSSLKTACYSAPENSNLDQRSKRWRRNNPSGQSYKDNDSDILRIFVSTDNHLGYMETHPVRGEDSFRSFEEVLALAKASNADMLLLGGDLFHDNKPSRNCIHKTITLLRKYCLGDSPVRIQFCSDVNLPIFTGNEAPNTSATGSIGNATLQQSKDSLDGTPAYLRSTNPSQVNYMSPYDAISLPVFIIHGNHDDPTGALLPHARHIAHQQLSPIDLLNVSNLVNYFGRVQNSTKFSVHPMLFRKGSTQLALYGLGNIRDERLYSTWKQSNSITWYRPPDPNSWFSLLTLHQNRVIRSTSSSTGNGLQDAMLPDWLDVAIWGHEHECAINFEHDAPYISQPGSSVATSLSPGESVPKHAGLLEVRGTNFRMIPIPLRTVREFILDYVSLSDESFDLNPADVEGVTSFLEDRVSKLIEKAQANFDFKRSVFADDHDVFYNPDVVPESLRTRVANIVSNCPFYKRGPADKDGPMFDPRDHNLRLPLVRLRVDHSGGYPSIVSNRFGQKFVGRVANAGDILLLSKQRNLRSTDYQERRNSIRGVVDDPSLDHVRIVDIQADRQEKIKVPDLVEHFLNKQKGKLELLPLVDLSSAVDDFVSKTEPKAIIDFVEDHLENAQKYVKQKAPVEKLLEDEADDLITRLANKLQAEKESIARMKRASVNLEDRGLDGQNTDTPRKDVSNLKSAADQYIEQRLDELGLNLSGRNDDPQLQMNNVEAEGESDSEEEEDQNEYDDDDVKVDAKAGRGRGRGRGRGGTTRKPPSGLSKRVTNAKGSTVKNPKEGRGTARTRGDSLSARGGISKSRRGTSSTLVQSKLQFSVVDHDDSDDSDENHGSTTTNRVGRPTRNNSQSSKVENCRMASSLRSGMHSEDEDDSDDAM